LGKLILTDDIRKAVKKILFELKRNNMAEISAPDLEKKLTANGMVFHRSFTGKIMNQLGVKVERRKNDVRVYLLDSWDTLCIHYWIIDTPSGSMSKGICKFCLDEKKFTNTFEASVWSNQRKPAKKKDSKVKV